MATLAATNPTLADIAKLMGPDNQMVADVAELLMQDNEILMDATFIEANGGTYHRHSQRTGIPAPTWRRYYEGVASTKSTYVQVDEPIGMMEARSTVDEDLVNHSGNPGQVRLIEAMGILEGFNQDLAQTMLYGAVSSSPAKFNGILPRYADTTAASGENVISAGGSGSDNASILLVTWSPRFTFLIYPRGSQAGLSREDMGRERVLDSNSNPFTAFEEVFKQQVGCVVRDWRGNVRIANIDKSALVAQSGAADILELMTAAVHKLPTQSMGARRAFYVNRTIMTMLDIQCQNKSNVYLTVGEEEGRPKISFRGIPIRICDQLQADEAAVS